MPNDGERFTRNQSPDAEMSSMVTHPGTIEQALGTTSTQLKAQRLLDFWVSGDQRRLEAELRHWRDHGINQAVSNEDGPADLLRCLVSQMMDEPDLFAPRSEKLHLGVWVDLLVHLAHPEASFE